jgi:hypothetical protein
MFLAGNPLRPIPRPLAVFPPSPGFPVGFSKEMDLDLTGTPRSKGSPTEVGGSVEHESIERNSNGRSTFPGPVNFRSGFIGCEVD